MIYTNQRILVTKMIKILSKKKYKKLKEREQFYRDSYIDIVSRLNTALKLNELVRIMEYCACNQIRFSKEYEPMLLKIGSSTYQPMDKITIHYKNHRFETDSYDKFIKTIESIDRINRELNGE